MPLKLIPPGGRRKQFYYARGYVNGKRHEFSLQTADRAEAEIIKATLELELLQVKEAPKVITFKYAAERFLAYRSKLADRDVEQVKRLIDTIGHMPVQDVVNNDLYEVAEKIIPSGKASNKNRWVMRPACSVMHFAADNKWCSYTRFKMFKEEPPKDRTAKLDVVRALIAATDKPLQKLFILWLGTHGDRVSDPCLVEWEKINLEEGTYAYFEHKSDLWREAVLSNDVKEELLEIKSSYLNENKLLPKYVFPWRTRFSIYNWWQPLRDSIGSDVTPHMLRHMVGKHLSAQGASSRVSMDRLGHKSHKSSMRYSGSDIDATRKYTDALPKLK